jgi:cytochrome P450
MSTAGTIADDVTVEALTGDPFPIYAELRRNAPVCYVPAVDLWFVTRWADVIDAAENREHFPASMPNSPLDRTLGGANVLTVDGATHAHMRNPMETTLRPRAVEEHAPEIVRRVADDLIDGFVGDGRAELMGAFCEPFSVLTLAEMIGLRDLDAPTLQRWFHELATGTSNYEGDPAKQAIADRTSAQIDDRLRPRLAELLELTLIHM